MPDYPSIITPFLIIGAIALSIGSMGIGIGLAMPGNPKGKIPFYGGSIMATIGGLSLSFVMYPPVFWF